MTNSEKLDPNEMKPITSPEELEQAIQEAEQQEQLYSIALFDILGFSKFVENNKTEVVSELYNKLTQLVHRMESGFNESTPIAAGIVPVPVSRDCKSNQFVADGNGFAHVCHFSDTFIIYVNYLLKKTPWLLRDSFYEPYPLTIGEIGAEYNTLIYERHYIYISFLQLCMEFFCESIKLGIPLRGCIATGMATMDKHNSKFFGRPLVEAARGEPAQNSIGVAFGKSFKCYHPIYNRYFIPYLGHIKEDKKEYLSPMMLDWPRYWRGHQEFKDLSITDCINKMNTNPDFSNYYDNAIKFADFSARHENWPESINRDGILDIIDYYIRVRNWYKSVTSGESPVRG